MRNGGENEDEEKMMSNQSAQVLLPFQVQRLNDRKNYCYDISGRMEFRSYIERKQADRSMIKSVIRFIAGLDQAVEEYLLMPDGLLLQPECMYLEMPEENLRAAYIPGRKEDFSKQLKELTAWLLENTYHEDREGVLLAYELYKSVQQENFLPGRLKELLREEKRENVQGELDMETNKTFVEEASDKGQQREEVDADSKNRQARSLYRGRSNSMENSVGYCSWRSCCVLCLWLDGEAAADGRNDSIRRVGDGSFYTRGRNQCIIPSIE